MIEPIMYVAVGFLLAGLLVIGFIPLVHARAVRLTMKRLEAVTPMSMAEIQAEKDQLRAEFAMTVRRLEMSLDQMKAKTTTQLAEIGRKGEAIGRLKLELSEKTAAVFALESKEQQLREELHRSQQELAAKATTLNQTAQAQATKGAELAAVTARFNELTLTADNERVELMALRAQVEVLQGQLEAYGQGTNELNQRIKELTLESERAGRELAEERARSETLGARVGEVERQLVAQTTEAEILSRRVPELTALADERGRSLADRDHETKQLRVAAEAAQRTERELRAELADTARRLQAIEAEKAQAEEKLRQALDESVRLGRQIETVKRDAEAAWASERTENAVMRERIGDVAAEVARLTSVIEGPGSPIDAILAGNGGGPNGQVSGNGHDSAGGRKATLADRIRMLQSRASRPPATGRA
jgi:hypothetical protein